MFISTIWARRLACALAAIGLVPVSSALAGPPGKWTRVTGVEQKASNIENLGLARTADGVLHIVYRVAPPGATDSVAHKALAKNAKSLAGPDTVAQLDSINESVVLGRTVDGGLRVFFAGLTGAPGTDGFMRTAVAGSDGRTWSPAVPASNTSASGVGKAYVGSGLDASPAADGTPVTIWGDSGPGDAAFHYGLDPAASDTHLFSGENRCCIIQPALALESKSGSLFAGWINTIGDQTRIEVRQLGGPTVTAPNSGAAQLQDRVGLSGRSGGGIYLAYTVGTNPFLGSPALWRVGAPKPLVMGGQRGAQHIAIARSAGGRMWLLWSRKGRVYAVRTNAAATKVGAVVSLKRPKGTGTSIYRVVGDGGAPGGALDLFGYFQSSESDLGYWHQRALPGLTLKGPAVVAHGHKATFKVTDAGDVVSGAKVTLKLGSKTVSGKTVKGKVKLLVPAGTKARRYTATAGRSGYSKATGHLRVT